MVEETEHEKARQKFYQDIGYAEDEEYYEFPKEVQYMYNDRQYLCDCAVIAILCAIM